MKLKPKFQRTYLNVANHIPNYPFIHSYPHMLFNPSEYKEAPPSPFFQTGITDGSHSPNQSDQKFTREARKVEQPEDPEDYYNEWIMSNLG